MSWERVDLTAPEFQRPTEPPYLCGLVYRGKRHAVTGPPEALKTVLAIILGLEHMRAGHGAFALLDFEMGEHATRLLLDDLGATPAEIAAVYYVSPDGPPTPDDLDALRAANVGLVVIDAAAGAFDVSALDDNKRQDAERFGRVWIDPLWQCGITTVLIDHVVKNVESRGRFAIGSERKLGAVDVALGLEAVTQLRRGGNGVVRVIAHKDRPGHLHRPRAGELHLTSDPDTHRITWTFKAATADDPGPTDGGFRPTILMDRILEYLAGQVEPVSRKTVTDRVTGKREYLLQGIDILVAEGRVREEHGAHGAKLLTLPVLFPRPVPPVEKGTGNTLFPLGVPGTAGNKTGTGNKTEGRAA